ncbi:MAG: hypothetical protein KDI90_06175 [Alphaproteobacteria bacterium]|nr:hypothetical protein [Alphaproteobacteria bacterium]MCB9975799.1 hypothetical protein [Rhodospirillales bacterium]
MKRFFIFALIGLCVLSVRGKPAPARVKAATSKPKHVTINAENPARLNITWYIKGKHMPEEYVTVKMGEGQFFLTDRSGLFLDFLDDKDEKKFRTKPDGTYLTHFKETITISREMIEQAIKRGEDIYYERAFTDHTLDLPVFAHIILRPVKNVDDDLSVTRGRVKFPEEKDLCHTGTGEPLFAEALFEVEGSGIFKAQWEIRKNPYPDTYRVLKTVHYPVYKELVIGFKSPEVPTELAGPLDLRLVILEPKTDIELPAISCLVQGTEETKLRETDEPGIPLEVLAPRGPEPITLHMRLRWSADKAYRFYRLIFYREDGGLAVAMDAPQGVREIPVTQEIFELFDTEQRYTVKILGYR